MAQRSLFLGKLKFFTIFNIILAIWMLAELIIYIILVANSTCSQRIYSITKSKT